MARSVRYRKERRGNHQHVRRRKERPRSEKFRGRAAGGDQSGKRDLKLASDHFVIANSRIPTGSMENTIMSHSRVIGSRLSYIKDDPERGDIVIFRYPDNEKVYYVKRVIGLPGETVEVKDGKVYINGSDTPLDEPYLPEPMEGSYGPYEVPEGCYFMMGDNRNNSLDARFWDNKFVAKNKIVAKVLFCYYPFNRIGKVN